LIFPAPSCGAAWRRGGGNRLDEGDQGELMNGLANRRVSAQAICHRLRVQRLQTPKTKINGAA
jgi:hypothetical protein